MKKGTQGVMKSKIFITGFVMILSFGFIGCYKSQVREYSNINLSDKTILASAGEGSISSLLKDVLRQLGWRVLVENSQELSVGTDGNNTELKSHNLHNARYQLYIHGDVVNSNFMGQDYNYDISIVNIKTGEEVLTVHGFDEAAGIANHFRDALKQAEYDSSDLAQ